jgi:hypothetical protein
MVNWMTTLAGIGGALTAAGGILSGLSKGQLDPTALSGLVTGIGLIFAKDFNVTGGTKKQ